MLVANTEKGEQFICAPRFSREKLSNIRQHTEFYCPQCKERVTMKIGYVMIPHFAHEANAACNRLFSEGESQEHLLGKSQLFDYFQRVVEQVELEPYIKSIAQRPDLLITNKNKQYAIEFQCSSIAIEKLLMRSDGYREAEIEPIWLFKTPTKKIDAGKVIQKITLSPLLQQAIVQQRKYRPYLITYNASKQQFVYFSNLLLVQGRTYLTKVQVLPLMKQRFPFYLPQTLTKDEFYLYWQLYKKSREQFVLAKLLRGQRGVQDPFLKSCYDMRIPVQKIPYYIGVPVRHAEEIPLFSLEWQAMFHYFCMELQISLENLCLGDIQLFLKQLHIEITADTVAAIKAYISFLLELKTDQVEEVGILEKLFDDLFAINTVN
ncbi:MAG: competence protein CoiA family protein [Lysinibacillus sp.]